MRPFRTYCIPTGPAFRAARSTGNKDTRTWTPQLPKSYFALLRDENPFPYSPLLVRLASVRSGCVLRCTRSSSRLTPLTPSPGPSRLPAQVIHAYRNEGQAKRRGLAFKLVLRLMMVAPSAESPTGRQRSGQPRVNSCNAWLGGTCSRIRGGYRMWRRMSDCLFERAHWHIVKHGALEYATRADGVRYARGRKFLGKCADCGFVSLSKVQLE